MFTTVCVSWQFHGKKGISKFIAAYRLKKHYLRSRSIYQKKTPIKFTQAVWKNLSKKTNNKFTQEQSRNIFQKNSYEIYSGMIKGG